MSTAEEQPSAAADLDSRLEFETMLADLSSRFINLAPGDVDREIEDALRRVCELLGIDMAVLWQWSAAIPDVVVPTHVHPRPETSHTFGPLSQESYPWVVGQMRAGRAVMFASLEELPPEAAVDRESGRSTGIKSNLTLPLAVGGERPVGALALNTLRHEREWSEPLVKRLQLVAQVFTHALARKRTDEALRQNEARLAAGADLAGLAHYEVDLARGAMFVDDRLRDICGVPPGRDTGLGALEHWMEHLHPDDRSSVMDVRQQMQVGGLDRVLLEYRYLHPIRGERWFHHTAGVAMRDAAGRATRTFGVFRDITDRKRAEENMRSLSRRLIQAHEEERAVLARELHDDVTQRLAVLAIEAGRAELAAAGTPQADTLRGISSGLVRLSEDIHSLAYQLHPSVLDELGLAEALRTECERRGRHGGVDISMDLAPLPPVLGKDAALCLYRVAQEALSNVIKHADARRANVVLRKLDGGLLLSVRDDGTGFDPKAPKQGRSLGLAGMRERLELVNGTLDIESVPGKGTSIVAWVPAGGASS